MYIRVSDGSNATKTAIDLAGTEQWRVSLGSRSITQTSTAGTLQDARNTHGTLPLSLTLMVRGGTKEKNRAIISRIISRMQGKVQVGELDGYDGLVFIGNLKSYTVNAQSARWYTVTLVIECEQWITGTLPIVQTRRLKQGDVYYFALLNCPEKGWTTIKRGTKADGSDATVEQEISPNEVPVVNPYTREWMGIYGGISQFSALSGESVFTHIITESHGDGDTPGLIPTPVSFRIKPTSAGMKSITIEATSADTPDNNWVIELENIGDGYTFELVAPRPGSDSIFTFYMLDASGTAIEAENIVKTISRWPVYAGGSMTISITGVSEDTENGSKINFTFTMPALKAL